MCALLATGPDGLRIVDRQAATARTAAAVADGVGAARWNRPAIGLLALIVLCTACSTPPRAPSSRQSDVDRFAPRTAGPKTPLRPVRVAPTAPQRPPAARDVPEAPAGGTVASVNAGLRFVVLDFYLKTLPEIGEHLGVYRRGQKVAVVKVTGPTLNSQIVADLLEGEVQIGDEARPE